MPFRRTPREIREDMRDAFALAGQVVDAWLDRRTAIVTVRSRERWRSIHASTDGRSIFADLSWAGECIVTCPGSLAFAIVSRKRYRSFDHRLLRTAFETELSHRQIDGASVPPAFSTFVTPELLERWWRAETQWKRRGKETRVELYVSLAEQALDALIEGSDWRYNDGSRHIESSGRTVYAWAECIAAKPLEGPILLSAIDYRRGSHRYMVREALRGVMDINGVQYAVVRPLRAAATTARDLIDAYRAMAPRLV